MEDATIVPILINTSAPPLPTPARCYEFGTAVAEAITTWRPNRRVAVIGSGGLSHKASRVNVESQKSADFAAVARAIHGRASVAINSVEREISIVTEYRQLIGGIRPDWDRVLLDGFARGEAAAFAYRLDGDIIEASGGNGGQEIRTWFTTAGALRNPAFEILSYEVGPWRSSGMGVSCRAGNGGASAREAMMIIRGLLGAVVIAATISTAVADEKKYGPGATDTEIKLGQTMAYSGPASSLGVIGRTSVAFYKMINEQGGVNGRKINSLSVDDGYSPPKTVEQTRRLIEQEQVLRDLRLPRHADQCVGSALPQRAQGAATFFVQRCSAVSRSTSLSLDDGRRSWFCRGIASLCPLYPGLGF